MVEHYGIGDSSVGRAVWDSSVVEHYGIYNGIAQWVERYGIAQGVEHYEKVG